MKSVWQAMMVSVAMGAGLAGVAGSATGAEGADLPAGEIGLFSFFRDNGQEGLFLARSRDGFDWEELSPPGKSFLKPELGPHKLMRDPCLRPGPDGTLHMVWTTGWGDRIIGYASTKDLVHWSEQRAIPVMEHEPTALNAWAPELFYDGARKRWVIFWATTIPGRFPATEGAGDEKYNHRIYCTATADFREFEPTRLLYDGGFNVIDATMFARAGATWMVVKDETLKPVRKHLRLVKAGSPMGPFEGAGPAFTGDWVEGPSVLELGGWTYVYFDHYTKPQYYGAVRSRDLQTWEDVSGRMKFPAGVRHGTMTRVPRGLVEALQGGH